MYATRIIPLALAVAMPASASPAPSWAIDHAASQVGFVAQMNGQPINGRFRRFDARIAFDPANLAGSSVTAIVDTGSATTGDATRDEALPTDTWFAAKPFPQAVFRSTQFRSIGGNHYVASGSLTIRGKAIPVSLPFQLAIAAGKAQMRGSLTLDRRTFGIGQGQFTDIEAVAAGVRVTIAISATKGA